MADYGFSFLAAIAVRTATVFLALVAGVRLTGRRQAGELNLPDLLLILILANSVQNAMTHGNAHLGVALVSSGTLLLLGVLFAALQSRHPCWERWVVGVPTVLVENGRLLRRPMRREGVTEDEVRAAVREQGAADLVSVKFAVLDVDGTISVILRGRESND